MKVKSESEDAQSCPTLSDPMDCSLPGSSVHGIFHAELCKGSGRIIATGGGCVTREENYPLIRQNATVVWLVRELSDLPTDGRPLSRSGSLEEMFKKRRALYERFADLTVQSRVTPEETVEAIIKEVCLK